LLQGEASPERKLDKAHHGFDKVHVADDKPVEVPTIDGGEDGLPLHTIQFAERAAEEAAAGGAAMEGETSPVNTVIPVAHGVEKAADPRLIRVQKAGELAAIKVRIEKLEPLLRLRFLPVPDDCLRGPHGSGEVPCSPPQTTDKVFFSRIPNIVKAAAPGATLPVIGLAEYRFTVPSGGSVLFAHSPHRTLRAVCHGLFSSAVCRACGVHHLLPVKAPAGSPRGAAVLSLPGPSLSGTLSPCPEGELSRELPEYIAPCRRGRQ
jgi:hypothetical protein